jgi:hypothetical protein
MSPQNFDYLLGFDGKSVDISYELLEDANKDPSIIEVGLRSLGYTREKGLAIQARWDAEEKRRKLENILYLEEKEAAAELSKYVLEEAKLKAESLKPICTSSLSKLATKKSGFLDNIGLGNRRARERKMLRDK